MKYKLTLLICLLATHLMAQEGEVKTSFSLNEAIEFALANNEQLSITNLEQEIADAQVGEIRSQGLPQVNINSALNYNYEVQKVLLDASNFDPSVPAGTEVEFAFGQAYDGNVALGVSQLIFDGSYFVGLQAARTFRELSTKEHIKTKIDIISAVTTAYYNVLINEEREALLAKNFERLDTLLYETQKMYENGFAEKIDVDRIRVSYNNVKVERTRFRKFNELSAKLLKFQMGLPLSQPIVLTDKLADVPLEVPTSPDESIDYNQRIEFSQVVTNQNLARLDLKNNRVQYLPKVYANFNYGYNTATAESNLVFQGDRWLNFGTLGLTVAVPVFDGLYKRYKVQKNLLQIDQLEFQKSMLKKSIDLEVLEARTNLESSLEMLQVQKENMELATTIFEITKKKYQEGVGSNLEVIEADTALKEAQTNYYGALYDSIIAQLELNKALGTLYN